MLLHWYITEITVKTNLLSHFQTAVIPLRFTLTNFVSSFTMKRFHANEMLTCECEHAHSSFTCVLHKQEMDPLKHKHMEG